MTERLEPKRAKLRIERLLDTPKQPVIDRVARDPTAVRPVIDVELPNRTNPLMDRELPKLTAQMMLAFDPSHSDKASD